MIDWLCWMGRGTMAGVDDGRLAAHYVTSRGDAHPTVLMISRYVFARAALPALGLVDGSASPDD